VINNVLLADNLWQTFPKPTDAMNRFMFGNAEKLRHLTGNRMAKCLGLLVGLEWENRHALDAA
jgi:hypothetical protein